MIHGESNGIELDPNMPLVVIKRLWLSIKIASLTTAAKKGLVENKNQIRTFSAFSMAVDCKMLEDENMLVKNNINIRITKESKIAA